MRTTIVIIIAIFCMSASPLYAHIGGESIFKINGMNTIVTPNTGELKYAGEFEDRAPEWYDVGSTVTYELETDLLPTPKEILEKTVFIWDFGDGTPPQSITYGLKNKHTYPKEGSYNLTLTADYGPAGFTQIPPQIIQQVRIHILKAYPAKVVKEFPKVEKGTATSTQNASTSQSLAASSTPESPIKNTQPFFPTTTPESDTNTKGISGIFYILGGLVIFGGAAIVLLKIKNG